MRDGVMELPLEKCSETEGQRARGPEGQRDRETERQRDRETSWSPMS
tara:strand:+ start:323 stop:463 length:141 start_codon:yes stop_codon:yes gene_type:complete